MMFLFFNRKIGPERLGLRFRDYDEDFYHHKLVGDASRGTLSEKPEARVTAPGVHNGSRPATAGSHHPRVANGHGNAAVPVTAAA